MPIATNKPAFLRGPDDWDERKNRINLATVITNLLKSPGRREGRWLAWHCPFHEEKTPSFKHEIGTRNWHCFGCDADGDAAALVMQILNCKFPQAKAYLYDLMGFASPRKAGPGRPRRPPGPWPAPVDAEEGPRTPDGPQWTEAQALDLVNLAALRLRDDKEAARARAYLLGPDRGLRPETIARHRLGWMPDGEFQGVWVPRGILIPWLDENGRLVRIKVRRGDQRKNKYSTPYQNAACPPRIYLGTGAIKAGKPLIVVEGEFDAMCVGQRVEDFASVVTLGSAKGGRGNRGGIDPEVLLKLLKAHPQFVALDGDPTGREAATRFPSHWPRVFPPEPFKDWTLAAAGGVDLRPFWLDALASEARRQREAHQAIAAAPVPVIVNADVQVNDDVDDVADVQINDDVDDVADVQINDDVDDVADDVVDVQVNDDAEWVKLFDGERVSVIYGELPTRPAPCAGPLPLTAFARPPTRMIVIVRWLRIALADPESSADQIEAAGAGLGYTRQEIDQATRVLGVKRLPRGGDVVRQSQ